MLTGCYQDILSDAHGRVQWNSGWRPNRIVHQCNLLLAALMRREPGMAGILYWAVGEGEEAWDARCLSPRSDDRQLANEVTRLALVPEHIVYLDDDGAPSESPTTCLEIAIAINGADLVSSGVQSLREFGLFGGDAEEAPDSGYMIDYVIHPRIDLTPGDTLERRLHLTFTDGNLHYDQDITTPGFGADLPVIVIDGVGEVYAAALAGHGINTVGDIAGIDPLRTIGDIPAGKLREFQAKARLVLRLSIDPTALDPLSQYSVSQILMEMPNSLARQGVPLTNAMRLQEALADLQISLDDEQLQQIALGELIAVERERIG